MDRKNDIIAEIKKIAGAYSEYEVFTDWIRCCAIAISNGCQLIHDKIWNEREKDYIETIKRYSMENRRVFSKMMSMLVETIEWEISDVLGEIYMRSNMGNAATGQFFTPYHISKLTAKVALKNYDGQEKITMNEPSCGGGGMIIAVADVLNEKGINYQKKMDVIAQDIDWKGVYMCYVQLSILGIKAVCVQGNTLLTKYKDVNNRNILITPAKRGLLI